MMRILIYERICILINWLVGNVNTDNFMYEYSLKHITVRAVFIQFNTMEYQILRPLEAYSYCTSSV